jgi:hypothetical protein
MQKAFIECVLCGQKLTVRLDKVDGGCTLVTTSPDQVATRAGWASLEGLDNGGYVCDDCFAAIMSDKKVIKKASVSNRYACHIYLPASWRGGKVVAILSKKGG